MSGFDQAGLAAAFEPYGGGIFTLLDGYSPPHPLLPEHWRPVVESPDPGERTRATLATWNEDFLELIPSFAGALRSKLLDVRAIAVPAEKDPMLVYVFEGSADLYALWIGWSAQAFGDHDPQFFGALPAPARAFLRKVHAGFAAPDAESCGLTPPQLMITVADWAECPDGIPGWEENWWEDCEPIDSRRLLRITGYGGNSGLFVSPDLPAGDAIYYSDGHLRAVRFFEELDRLMCVPVVE